MTNVTEKRFPNVKDAVAFQVAFAPFVYSYGNVGWDEYERYACTRCNYMEQFADFLAPKSECRKKDGAILQTYEYGVSIEIHDLLIENFDITEKDFRPIRNKAGDIVFFQITPQHIMLPLSDVNRVRKLKPCKKCGSVEYRIKDNKTKEDWEYYYISRETLDDLHDINRTYEEFGMHKPRYLVSRRVYDFLTERYPRMAFAPFFLKEKE